MTLYYDFGGGGFYEFDLTYKQVREAVADICSSNKSDCDVIKDFIYKSDLEDAVFDIYNDDLMDYFESEAYQKYLDNKADTDYWEHTDIHGGV